MSFDIKNVKRYFKKKIKKLALVIDEKANHCDISKKSIGILFRSMHISAPGIILTMALFAPQIIVLFCGFYLFCVGFFFLLLDGCFLTLIEQRLCNDDFTIIDPTLELYRIEINNKNRMFVSYIVGFIYSFMYVFIYFIRFVLFK
jgi:hypothetical protein